mmetsp:Transcript_21998/g.55450  ORF Transcript_21998/g.55450 Transcript_21998/m.55450 type:complete len:1070 (-) Transcript_21998:398-3607(-)
MSVQYGGSSSSTAPQWRHPDAPRPHPKRSIRRCLLLYEQAVQRRHHRQLVREHARLLGEQQNNYKLQQPGTHSGSAASSRTKSAPGGGGQKNSKSSGRTVLGTNKEAQETTDPGGGSSASTGGAVLTNYGGTTVSMRHAGYGGNDSVVPSMPSPSSSLQRGARATRGGNSFGFLVHGSGTVSSTSLGSAGAVAAGGPSRGIGLQGAASSAGLSGGEFGSFSFANTLPRDGPSDGFMSPNTHGQGSHLRFLHMKSRSRPQSANPRTGSCGDPDGSCGAPTPARSFSGRSVSVTSTSRGGGGSGRAGGAGGGPAEDGNQNPNPANPNLLSTSMSVVSTGGGGSSSRAGGPYPNGYFETVNRLLHEAHSRYCYNHPVPLVRQPKIAAEPFSFGDGTKASHPVYRDLLEQLGAAGAGGPPAARGAAAGGGGGEHSSFERMAWNNLAQLQLYLQSGVGQSCLGPTSSTNNGPGPGGLLDYGMFKLRTKKRTEFLCEVVIPQKNRCAYIGKINIRVKEGEDLQMVVEAHKRIYNLTGAQSEKLLRVLVLTRTQIQHGSFSGGMTVVNKTKTEGGVNKTTKSAGSSRTSGRRSHRSRSAPISRNGKELLNLLPSRITATMTGKKDNRTGRFFPRVAQPKASAAALMPPQPHGVRKKAPGSPTHEVASPAPEHPSGSTSTAAALLAPANTSAASGTTSPATGADHITAPTQQPPIGLTTTTPIIPTPAAAPSSSSAQEHPNLLTGTGASVPPQTPAPAAHTFADSSLKLYCDGDVLRRLIYARIFDLQLLDEHGEDLPLERLAAPKPDEDPDADALLIQRAKELCARKQQQRQQDPETAGKQERKLQQFLTEKGLAWWRRHVLDEGVNGVWPGSVQEQAKALNQGVFREFVDARALPEFLLASRPLLTEYFRVWCQQWALAYFSHSKACPEFELEFGDLQGLTNQPALRTYSRKVGRMLLDLIKAAFMQAVLFSPGAFRESDPLIRAFCSAVLEQEEIVRRVRIVLVPKQSGEAERSDLSEHADFLERILLLVTMTLFLASNEPGVWDREAFAQSDIGIHPAVLKKIYDRSEEIRLL